MHPLDSLFHPRGIAVVGASSKPGNWGTSGFLQPLIDFGFKGGIYPVNMGATPVAGLKAYSKVSDIPGPVDYVVISVPMGHVVSCIGDCAAKGVKFVSIYTAGFSESGQEEGKEQEARFLEIARRSGMRLLGPNCVGIYYPSGGISFSPVAPKKSGSVSYLSQSGRFCNDLLSYCEQRGVSFNKMASFGNALDINESDLMQYLGQDNETKIVAAYIEGIKDGLRFSAALREACRRKPVIVVKGGSTEEGRRAALSHTAALNGREEVWRGLMKQSGAISAGSLEEMSDILMTFCIMPEISGMNIGLIGSGGGANVLAADAFSHEGFRVPTFSYGTQRELREFIPPSGTWVVNPVDFSPQTAGDPWLTSRAIEVMAKVADIDVIILHYMIVSWGMGGDDRARSVGKRVVEVSKNAQKPVVAVLETHGTPEIMKVAYEIKQDWIRAGLCVYSDVGRAAMCLGNLARYKGVR